MLNIKSKILVSSALVLSQHSFALEPIVINSIDWCPQLCVSGDKEGYVMDTVKAIFKDSPYSVDVESYPWTRAIKNVESGKAHALLSPAKQEAPNLVYPKHEVGIQRMCFFTKSDSNWKYAGPESLNGLRVGIAKDTAIEELNSYILKNASQFDYLPYIESYLDISLKKTRANRIDTFLFTYNSTQYELNKRNLSSEFKEVGCMPATKIYMAFTPDVSKKSEVEKMINYFDNKMGALKESGEIKNIMSNYGLEDWQLFL